MKKTLILCTGNSCRSQMAEGLISNAFPEMQVYSAGTKPETVNPFAVKAMAEIGIDISKNISNHADEYAHIDFDYVFTVCDNAKEICPIYPKTESRKVKVSKSLLCILAKIELCCVNNSKN